MTHGQPTREPGKCPVCGEQTATPSGVYCAAHRDRTSRPPKSEWVVPQEDTGTRLATDEENGGDVSDTMTAPSTSPSETAPSSPYSGNGSSAGAEPSMGNSAGGRLRRLFGGGKAKAPKAAPSGPERPPKPPKARGRRGPRISTANDATEIYGQLAGRLEMSRHFPAGRMMSWQAPMFGVIFDNAIADSWIDRQVAQALMRQKAKWEPLADLVLPPVLLVGMKNALDQGNMAAFNAMSPILEYMVERHLLSVLPAAKEAIERKAAEQEAVAEVFPNLADLETPDGTRLSPAQALIGMLFAPPPQPPPETEDSDNGEGVPTDAVADPQGAMGL